MKRVLMILGSIVGLLALCVIAILLWVGTTESGLRWALNLAPDNIKVETLKGNLSNFSFSSLSFDFDGGRVEVRGGKLVWQPLALLGRKVAVERLAANNLIIELDATEVTPETDYVPWAGVRLPIDATVDDLRIAKIELRQEGQSVTDVGGVTMAGSLTDNTLKVETLTLTQDQNSISLAGEIDLTAAPSGTVKLESQVDWALGQRNLNVAGTVSGTWQSLEISQDLSAPVILSVQASVNNVLTETLQWAAQVRSTETNRISLESPAPVSQTQPAQTEPAQVASTQVIELTSADLRSEGQFSPGEGLAELQASLVGSVSGGTEQLANWDLQLDTNFADRDLEITMIELSQQSAGTPGSLTIAGRVINLLAFIDAQQTDGSVDLQGEWASLGWPLTAESPDIRSNGDFTVNGNSENYRINANANGTVYQQQLNAVVNASVLSESITIKSMTVNAGPSILEVSGAIDSSYQLQWALTSPDLGQVIPGASGNINSNGALSGPRDAPRVKASVKSTGLRFNGVSVGATAINVDAPVTQMDGKLALNVESESIRSAGTDIAPSLTFSVTGSGARHDIKLDAQLARQGSLQVRAAGGVSQQTWSGTVSTLTLSDPVLETWALSQQVTVAVAANNIQVSQSCLKNDNESVCFMLDKSLDSTTIDAVVERLELANLNRFTELYDLQVEGVVTGLLRYNDNPTQSVASLEANLESTNARLKWEEFDGETIEQETLDIETLRLEATQTDVLKASASLVLTNGDRIEAEGGINAPLGAPDFSSAVIDGSARINIANLTTLPPMLLNNMSVNGQLAATVNLGGTVSAPAVSATADVTQASARIRELGLSLDEIELTARTNDASQIVIDGQVRSGEGVLNVDGDIDLSNVSEPAIRMRAKGERLQLANTAELNVVGNVDMATTIENQLISLTGAINIAEAELDFKLPESAVLASDDVVLLGEEESKRGLRQQLDLTVDLGDKTHIKAQGLDANLRGRLRIYQAPGGIVRGEGQIRVEDGRYDAYGQNLKIDRGRLIFNGVSIDDPSLDLRAQKTAGSITAGVSVSGRASSPQLNLYSTPSLPDQDILSVLIFDKTMGELGSQDALTLLRIANSLRGDGGPSQIAKATQRMQDSLGLTDLELQLTDDSPSIQAGKQLSSRFYIGYGYGLLDATQSLFLRYKISEAWSIKADMGATSGADLRYQIER